MALSPGCGVGPYEIQAPLGAGGMGEVYRARDPRLNRDVAIKVLARAGSGDTDRQRRFLEEAQAASALNHPNILTVYDVGVHEGTPYIVSELVDGVSVRAMLARAPFSLREALTLAVQMADGLAAAHEAGIVHRDFKPENVMVTRDGRVKILDFGLARVGTREGGTGSDADATVTATGVIIGTVPYMSPEQARGATVDYRTDQFALGLTLYEMVTGRRAFRAETPAQILAAIIEDEPESIAAINPRVPVPVRWVIERCITKDPRQRYDATTDLARDLRTLRDRLAEFTASTEIARPPARQRARTLLIATGGVVLAALALATLVWSAAPGSGTDLSRHRLTPIATDAGYQGSPAWSPDGKTLTFVADVDGVLQVFTRALGSPGRAQVTHARFDCAEPFWSPDGTRLYYRSLARDRAGLWSISSAGGEPELVLENVKRAAVSPDGRTLAFFRDAEKTAMGLEQLWLSSPIGSPPVRYTRRPFGDRLGFYASPHLHFSPDGSKLGIWVVPWWAEVKKAQAEFWVLPMRDAPPYLAPPPAPDLPTYTASFSWLPDNRRIVSALPYPRPGMHLWLSDTESRNARLLTMTGEVENDPVVSPDGSRLALTLQQSDYDLYQLSVERRPPAIVLATSRSEMDPAWSPVNAEMAFTTDRTGHEEIWLRSERGDWERPLVTAGDFGANQTYYVGAPAFSPDGQRIAYTRLGADETRIWITSVAGGATVQLAAGEYVQDAPSWSPDGAWIAYVQLRLGEEGLVKKRVGAKTPPEVLATSVADFRIIAWSPDGTWIAYTAPDGMSVVSPDGKSKRVLHEQQWMAFAWAADSQRLYGIRQSDDFKHLTFTSVDLSGNERVLNPDFMPLPVAQQPVRGLTRASGNTFIAAIAHVHSDLWMLEGFDRPPSLRDRLSSLWPWRR